MSPSDSDPEYSNSRWTAVRVLAQYRKKQPFVAEQLHAAFRKNHVPPAERPFVTELVQGTIRRQLQLNWILRQFVRGKYEKLPDMIRAILQISLYQKLFLSRVPDYAIVDEAVRLTRRSHQEKLVGFVNGVLRNVLRHLDELDYPNVDKNPIEALSIRFSFPEWMVERWVKQFDVKFTRALLEALNRTPVISIRVNTLKTSVEEYASILEEGGFEPEKSAYLDEFLTIQKSGRIERLPFYEEGYFSIQDESAGLAAHVLNPQPGERILDMCAAPGGKTTHIAERMKNQGQIIAADLYANRLKTVEENARRLGINCIDTLEADGRKLSIKPVDRVLIDAPCSGLGVISRKPDIKWRRTLRDIQEMKAIQSELLENAAGLVRAGGVLVYSTCTIEPEENENQIFRFLKNHKNFELEHTGAFVREILTDSNGFVKTFPNVHHIDGSFIARLVRRRRVGRKKL